MRAAELTHVRPDEGDEEVLSATVRRRLAEALAKSPDLPADEVVLLRQALILRWDESVKFTSMRCWGDPGGTACLVHVTTVGLCPNHDAHRKRHGTTRPIQPQRKFGVWDDQIVARAIEIVNSYEIPVTLRQLFYRLVSEEMLTNTKGDYNNLSSKTARARRKDQFPDLVEHGRTIHAAGGWSSPDSALHLTANNYRVERTENQDYTIVLGVEKNALSDLLRSWFGYLGIPTMALGGYGSETMERKVRELAERYDRPAVLIYAGDFDASGMNIGEKFVHYTTDVWDETVRIGLSPEQIDGLGLPMLRGKVNDPRAKKFVPRYPEIHARAGFGKARNRHGNLVDVPVQVELDAVDPQVLYQWYQDAINQWWDANKYREMLHREEGERERLQRMVNAGKGLGWPNLNILV